MVRAWLEVIDPRTIPTGRLNDSYLAAVRRRTFPGMLTPMEVVQAYREIAENEASDRRIAETKQSLAYLDSPPPLSPAERRQIIGAVRTGAITEGRFNAAADVALRLVQPKPEDELANPEVDDANA